ncbi:hypothetical protein GDO78_015756 [Eleutherodactylus coqui]|uniref:Uncharacterized protein n=1 Tax=Eleutherodactylus coqui TaxID=57060 RepID=A0A8J6EDF0_ELECQ|nr:hypothetical protein GDO78_015756 [Eleutherodactylus coqui]
MERPLSYVMNFMNFCNKSAVCEIFKVGGETFFCLECEKHYEQIVHREMLGCHYFFHPFLFLKSLLLTNFTRKKIHKLPTKKSPVV